MTFAHVGFAVKDFKKSRDFYEALLKPLGLTVVNEGENWVSIGKDGRTELWIGTFGLVPGPFHFAFEAGSRGEADAFHAAGLAAGGKDNGAPGIRADYAPNYYAAFVIDPDGHNVEVVFRG